MCVAVCVYACLCVERDVLTFCVALLQDSSKSPRPMKKFLPGNRKKERKPSDDEVQIRKSKTNILLSYVMCGPMCSSVLPIVIVIAQEHLEGISSNLVQVDQIISNQ